ncbi:ABC transporter substrate-binding protein [Burkholderia sp. PU8-34]
MKKLPLFVTVTLAAGGAYAKDWSTLRFGVDPTYAPFESKAPDGKVVGFDIDLGNEICRRLNAKCVWVQQDFDSMIPALKAKKFDGVLSSMTVTPERAKQIAFTQKLYNTSTRLVARKDAHLAPTAESLKGKSVGVQQGTIQETYAKEKWAPRGVNVVSYQNQDQVYRDLESGHLDATLQDALGFLKTPRDASLAFAGPAHQTGDAAIGLRKEDGDLKARIDKSIADMIKDGTYRKIESKYFDFDLYGG